MQRCEFSHQRQCLGRVVDRARLENYFDPRTPVPAKGPIQLQTHDGEIRWRNLFIREIPGDEANRWLRGILFDLFADDAPAAGTTPS